VYALLFTRDNKLLISAGDADAIQLWDAGALGLNAKE
jgi:hypothetical protein